ncbi:hypothetical protein E2N92_12560 [Methanofollis formosanus]|uniref:DUF3344 domain-containing protein n=1 Tax=Methanofollis formosanus TaxID=299308 RepID=A0A8G1EGU6_9EURY|nr:hypothetical protein [Methanofollis formosanus]QYZ80203.1 hypothetical protein E2N92_12560 [Methanofollis formosanus]
MALLCLCIAIALMAAPASAAGTTYVEVTKYADNNYSTVDRSENLSYTYLKSLDGDVVSNGDIYMQGPVFLDEWIDAGLNENDYNNWDQTEEGVNLVSYGGHNGTSLKNIVSEVGGMTTGDEIAIRSVGSKTYTMWFNATHVNSQNSRLGDLVLTWWDSVYGDVPTWGDGMRLYFYNTTDNNFTNWDMHEALPSWYWKYWVNKTDNSAYPSAKGLSVKQVNTIDIYPPHRYDFATGGDTVEYAYEGGVTGVPSASNVPNTPFASTANIASDDNQVVSISAPTDQYAAQRFVFNVTESASNIEKLAVTWNGTGTHASTPGADLYIWNSSSYELLQGSTSGSEVTLTGEETSSISNYVVNGNVTVLAKQKGATDRDTSSTLSTDYVKLVVTHHHTN